MSSSTPSYAALKATLDALDPSSFGAEDAQARQDLILSARALVNRLTRPYDRLMQLVWVEPMTVVALRISIDLELFDHLSSHVSAPPKTTVELAEATKSSPLLLNRLLRHLAAVGYVQSCDQPPDSWRGSSLTETLRTGSNAQSVIQWTGDVQSMLQSGVPAYFRAKGYAAEPALGGAPFETFNGDGKPLFDWLRARPDKFEMFNRLMDYTAAGRPDWTVQYPVSEILEGADMNGVLMVDIGGGMGYDVAALRRIVPKGGRAICQDRKDVVEQAMRDRPDISEQGVEYMAHNFFEEQPVKGARIYHMSAIMHDWPDADCVKILTYTKQAMTKGYSRILLHDRVLPEPNECPPQTSALDLEMMSLLAAKERDLSMWKTLLESVDLKIVRVCGHDPSARRVIEVDFAGRSGPA